MAQTRLAVAAWYDGSAPARLTALRFAGPAPVVPDADTAVSLDRTVVSHYYEDQPGWDAAR